jgi:GT2 family glycosyltransferase
LFTKESLFSLVVKLSVIIIYYKTPELLLDCLQSVHAFPVNDLDILVIDNDSRDGIESTLSKNFPGVRYLNMGYNAGFARANNRGILESDAEFVLLLNSDTLVLHDAINRCLKQMESSDDVASGVQLLNVDGSPQISGNFAIRGGLNYLMPLPYTGNLFRWMALRLKVKRPSIPEVTDVQEVDWINGAFLMVRRTAIERAGLLDNSFFLYAEEAEWCHRLKKQGRLRIYGNLSVYHLQGASANEAFASGGHGYYNLFDRKGAQILVSNMLRIRKEFGVGWLLFHWMIQVLTIFIFGIGVYVEKIYSPQKIMFTFNQWKGFVRNMRLLTGMLPDMILNRKRFYKVL